MMARLGIWTLAALVVVAVANAAARLTWSLAGETGVPVSDIAAALAGPAADAPLDLSPILALAPFGAPAAPAAPQVVAQETSLVGLILHGVVTAQPSGDSTAVIASDGGPAELYAVGDSIGGKATLREVLADRVLLQVGDRVESLSFPKPGENAGAKNILAKITNSGVPATTSSVAGAQTPMIEDLRNKIAANPQSFLDGLGVSATEKGYAVAPTASAGLLRTGLRPGDVIATVNGQPVGNIEQDRRLLDQVIASGQVRIEVVRDGRRIVMSFPLQ